MNISKLKELFFKGLENTYPKEETESFFYLLTEHYLKHSRLEIALDPFMEIRPHTVKEFETAAGRLLQYEPIQYIIGSIEFLGLKFKVDKNVLIPRPETEELVQWVIKDVEKRKNQPKTSILDIGTGSGCIAVSLSKNLTHVDVDAVDISEEALGIAQLNAVENGVEVNFIKEDILKKDYFEKNYDIIVSNPPYVTLSEKDNMSSNVVDHEPYDALFVPKDDPLIFYKQILRFGHLNLNENGAIYFEINEYLSDVMLDLKEIQYFPDIELRKDIFGKDRMIKCSMYE